MNSFLEKSRYSLIIAGSLLAFSVFSGCQIDHLSQWDTNVLIPSRESFIVLGDNHFSEGTSKDIIGFTTSLFSSSNFYIYFGDMVENTGNHSQMKSFLNPSPTIDNVMPWHNS